MLMCVLFQGICLILKCNEVGGVDPTTFVFIFLIHFIVVQLLSRVQLFVTPWAVARQAPPSPTVSWSLLKFMSIESVMLSNHLILCRPLLLLVSRLFVSGGQSIEATASVSVLPVNIHG